MLAGSAENFKVLPQLTTFIQLCTQCFYFTLTFSLTISPFLFFFLLSPSFVFFASKQWVLQGDASSSLRCLFSTRRHEGSDHCATRTNWMGQLLGPHYVWYSSSLSTPPFSSSGVISLPCWCATKRNEFFMSPLCLPTSGPPHLSTPRLLLRGCSRGKKEGERRGNKKGRWLMPRVTANKMANII